MSLSKIIRWMLPFIVLGVCVLLSLKLLDSRPSASSGAPRAAPSLRVESKIVERQSFTVNVESFGILQARTSSDLYSLVSGQVISVSAIFEDGAFFSKNDVLLTIDAADYEVAVQVARSNVANAELALADEQARQEQAQRDWQKQRNPVDATDYALRLPQMRAAEANLEASKAQLALASLNLERTQVRAPYNGRILKTYATVGGVIGSNFRLAQVYSTDVIEVRLPIANKDLQFLDLPEPSQISLGGYPLVQLENGLVEPVEFWAGQVVRTEGAVDPASQQLYVVARVTDPFLDKARLLSSNAAIRAPARPIEPQKHPLKIGQYVRATISGRQLQDVIVIPSSSIYQGSYVYTVVDQKLQRTPIQITWQNQQISVIKSGLTAGSHLVTTILGQVTSGTAVIEDLEAFQNVEGNAAPTIEGEP